MHPFTRILSPFEPSSRIMAVVIQKRSEDSLDLHYTMSAHWVMKHVTSETPVSSRIRTIGQQPGWFIVDNDHTTMAIDAKKLISFSLVSDTAVSFHFTVELSYLVLEVGSTKAFLESMHQTPYASMEIIMLDD